MIFVVRVTTNKEDKALEMITDRAEKRQLSIFSVVRPHGLRGYILLEALDRDSAEDAVFNLPYVKGIIGKTLAYDDVKNLVKPEVQDFNIEVGDIVEMIADLFKKEKGKVMRVDKQKREVVVSLLGAAVPIPVTVKMDNVRVIRRGSEEAPTDDSKDDSDSDINYENDR